MSITSSRTVTFKVTLNLDDNLQFNSGQTASLLNSLILGATDRQLFGDDSTKLVDSQVEVVTID
jgi:hypothetical protein